VGPASAATAPATVNAYYWPQQKGDINRTGFSPYKAPFELSKGPTWSWKDPTFDVNRFTPLIDDERNIYIGTIHGRLYKFSHDGRMIWEHNTGNKLPAVPVLMDGSLFYNRQDGVVVALDMETHAVRWEAKISNSTASDTACLFAQDGLVISATEMGNGMPGMGTNTGVVALHAGNGSHVWTFTHRWPSYNWQASSPGDGTLVFQDRAGGLYRISLADGTLLWESGIAEEARSVGDFTTGAAVVGPNGLVYVASNHQGQGIIHAYRLADGKAVWRRQMGMVVNQAVAVARLAGSDDRLSVVAGIGENPLFPASVFLSVLLFLVDVLACGCCLCACCCTCCRQGARRCRCAVLALLLAVPAQLALVCAYHQLSVRWEAKPGWLFFVRDLPAAMAALDAETGDPRWTYTPPRFEKPACEGDESFLGPRMYKQFVGEPGDPICLPDNWAQVIVDASGTTYGGHQDGYLYAVRDADGSGTIDPEKEVSRYFLGAAFQASQAIAPGLLAVTPCGGGLSVWTS